MNYENICSSSRSKTSEIWEKDKRSKRNATKMPLSPTATQNDRNYARIPCDSACIPKLEVLACSCTSDKFEDYYDTMITEIEALQIIAKHLLNSAGLTSFCTCALI